MKLGLTTPALLFSTTSLIMLAYTNRFVALGNLVRNLYSQHKQSPGENLIEQIKNLRQRIGLIRDMQSMGVLSLFCCVLSMLLIYLNLGLFANIIFILGLILLMISLGLSTYEIYISTHAIGILLSTLEEDCN
jgi:hypothetical protein